MGLLKYYSIGEFAKAIGKTTKTLRNWDKNGKLKPVRVEDTGYRYYSQEQLNHFLSLICSFALKSTTKYFNYLN